jgi:DNA-binding transcriptional MerR regulator
MTRNDSLDEARHPIGVAARRTGVTPAALRAWERRYGAVVPARSEGGQRLYSDRELRRLKLLREAVEGGRAISRVVDLEADELAELVEADRRAAGPARGPVPGTGVEVEPGPILGQAMEAVEELAPKALEEALRRGAVTLSPSALVEEVLVPLLQEIGERWRSGDLRPAAEHLASTVIRRFLEWLTEAAEVSTGAPLMLAATPAGQRHEFGALLAAVTGALAGWRVVYLGPILVRLVPGRREDRSATATAAAFVVTAAAFGLLRALTGGSGFFL